MGSWITWAAVAAGGALGSLLRFWLTAVIGARTGSAWPFHTLVINVLGSFAIGWFATWTAERVPVPADWRVFVMVGVCGGFTTFSSFSLQTLDLARGGAPGLAAAYVAASLVLCLLGVWAGFALARV
jgi:CrcB protein